MPDRKPTVVVIGSMNMDLVVRAPAIPRPGETVLGDQLRIIPGGKGANQAVAAARLGARCHLVGAVGDDAHGRRIIEALNAEGVATDHVRIEPDTPTGAALITVDPQGRNGITVASGANHRVTPGDVDRAAPLLRGADVCLLQLEILLETNLHSLRLCRRYAVTTVLDAAPAISDPPDALFAADVLTANLGEAETLAGRTGSGDEAGARSLLAAFRDRNCRQAVLKLGERGCAVLSDRDIRSIPAFPVDVVDSTAAGDAFNAALAVYLATSCDLFAAARRANAAGALACTALGAMPAMPLRGHVETLLKTHDAQA